MKYTLRSTLLFSMFLLPGLTIAGAGCVGTVTKLWVEADDSLYFNLKPLNGCGCNSDESGSKLFVAPASQLNREEQYSALLAAFMAEKEVMAWFDWQSSDGSKRCRSWNVSFSK